MLGHFWPISTPRMHLSSLIFGINASSKTQTVISGALFRAVIYTSIVEAATAQWARHRGVRVAKIRLNYAVLIHNICMPLFLIQWPPVLMFVFTFRSVLRTKGKCFSMQQYTLVAFVRVVSSLPSKEITIALVHQGTIATLFSARDIRPKSIEDCWIFTGTSSSSSATFRTEKTLNKSYWPT